ncbi:MAG: NAD-dependent epimerase/dehydratase family protein, partial [Ktedonobacteraceae bacterium]
MASPSRILITGCTGFVGSYLVEQCRRRYPRATLFGLAGPTSRHVQPESLYLLVADISRREEVQEVIAQTRPDLIFHLAALSSVALSWQDPLETLKVNTEGTIHVLEALRRENLTPRVLLIGSGEQ